MAARHLPEDALVEYVTGTLPEALSLVVATHLALCTECRAQVHELEHVGGALLAEIQPVAVAEDVLERMLARLDAPAPTEPNRWPARADLPDLPEPLRGLVADRPWKRIAPGISTIALPIRFGEVPATLTRLEGPFSVPRHGHGGIEAQLVLGGGFSDGPAVFRRGDVQWLGTEDAHEIHIHGGEACFTLLVKDSPLVQHTLKGRLFAWITGA